MDAILGSTLTSHGLAWLLVVGLPLLAAAGCVLRPRRDIALSLAPWSMAPALAAALWPPAAAEYPWLLLGTQFGLDQSGRIFLLFTAFLWICSTIYAGSYLAEDRRRHRFFAFFLLTAAGNLGLVIAQDMLSFYLFFVLMTFAAYGLIVHDATSAARRAGLIYVVLAVLGEVLLVTCLLLIGTAGYGNLVNPAPVVAAAPNRNLIIALVLAGFGIKAGAVPLHLWLPLAHPVAPTPASAVLSGAMIKAGLLGWLRFLPLGEAALPEWSGLCMAAGLTAAFYGVLVGLTQFDPKTVLAYSSISQMGVMLTTVGIGLALPESWPFVLATILFYALHHSLAKGALFLGVGMAGAAAGGPLPRLLFRAGTLLPALAMAAAPLTSGALAKAALKEVSHLLPSFRSAVLPWLLTFSALATALLMAHFLFFFWSRSEIKHGNHGPGTGQWLSWGLVLAGVFSAAWVVTPVELEHVRAELSSSKTLWSGLWTVLLGGLLGWAEWRRAGRTGKSVLPSIPPGDLLIPLAALLKRLHAIWRNTVQTSRAKKLMDRPAASGTGVERLRSLLSTLPATEAKLLDWTTAGAIFLLLTIALLALIIF